MLKHITSARGFLMTLAIAFLFSIVISVLFILPHVEKTVLEMQETVSETEKKLASEYLNQYVLDRVAVLRDIAGYPIVKNGVMGSGISPADLNDFLAGITILGRLENMALLDIAAEPVYSRSSNTFTAYNASSDWFNRIIVGATDFEINLVRKDDSDYFQLAVPVSLDDLVEGVLVSEVKVDLEAILMLFFPSGERSLKLTKNGVTIGDPSNALHKMPVLTLLHTITPLDVEMQYLISTDSLDAQKEAFLWSVMSSMLLAMLLTFFVLAISGNILIVAPYKRLQDITLERNQAKDIAEKSSRAKGEFLATMSHEIRTPINGVLGMLGLLARSQLNGQQQRYLKLAKTSADSLLSLINDILDFSKIEAGKLDLEILDFDLRRHLEEVVNAMAYRAEENNIELILDTGHIERRMVAGDPGRLRQILTNLIGNAIKFTPEGEIVIRAELEEQAQGVIMHCSVADTGIGIPSDKLDRLFQSFSQVDSSNTREYGGTGLGLAIVKQICELMGGTISVRSQVGEGSEFIFCIRFALSSQHINEKPFRLDITHRRVLIVDDNATNREVLRGQLEHWGAVVIEAMDGPTALEVLDECYLDEDDRPVEVAILDMQMPGMDGATLSRRIRQHSRFDSLKMVMMTSVAERGDAQYFADLGFSAYFSKPTTTSELHDALAVILQNGKALDEAKPLLNRHNLLDLKREEKNLGLAEGLTARVLLVEDNAINQEVALGLLEDMGVHADIANNGLEALSALYNAPKLEPFHLILMDCQMPEMDGYEATKKIRLGGERIPDPAIPIVAMTANAMKGDREKCLSVGMDDYMTKPIDPDELTRKVEKWLNRNSEADEAD